MTLYYLGLQVTAGVCIGFTVAQAYKLVRRLIPRILERLQWRRGLDQLYQDSEEEVTE